MATLDELRARAEELRASLAGIVDEYRDADMPETVQGDFDSADAELREVDGKIEAIEARAARMVAYAKKTPSVVERGNPAPAVHRQVDPFDINEIRSAAVSESDFVERVKDNAKRVVASASFARITSRSAAQERVTDLLENYDTEDGALAKRMLLTGSPIYERAFGKAMKACSLAGLSNEEQRAMSTANSGGGYAVPFQLDPTVILTNNGAIGDLRSISRVETIVGKQWQGVTSAGITVSRDGTPAAGEMGRQAEAAEAADGSFTLAQPTVTPVRVQGFVPFTVEIDADWGGLRSEITRMLVDAKGREELESFTLGDGTGTPNQPVGVVGGLSSSAHVTAAGEAVAAADVYDLETALAPRFRAAGQFMANKAIYNKIRQLDSNGGAQLWEHIGAGLPSKLLGYNVHENSFMDGTIDATVTATNLVLLFGDFSQFLIVDRVGMEVELVPHIFGTNGRPTGQRGIYAFWRNNATVLTENAFRLLKVATTV